MTKRKQKNDVEVESTFAILTAEESADLGLPPPSDDALDIATTHKPKSGRGTLLLSLLTLLITLLTLATALDWLPVPEILRGKSETSATQPAPVDENDLPIDDGLTDVPSTPEPTTISTEEQKILQYVDVSVELIEACPDQAGVNTELRFADNLTETVTTCFDLTTLQTLLSNQESEQSNITLPKKINTTISSEQLQGNEETLLTIQLFEDENETVPFQNDAEVILSTSSKELIIANALPIGTNHYLVPVSDGMQIITITAPANIFISTPVELMLSTVGSDGQILQYPRQITLQNPLVGNACKTTDEVSARKYDPMIASDILYRPQADFTIVCDQDDRISSGGDNYDSFTHYVWLTDEQLSDDNVLNIVGKDTIIAGLCGPTLTECAVKATQGVVQANTREFEIQNAVSWNSLTVERTGRTFNNLIEVQFLGRIFSGNIQPIVVEG